MSNYFDIDVEPKSLDAILSEAGIEIGGPSEWGHSFWGRALRCAYDGLLTRRNGHPPSQTEALVIGVLCHACIGLYKLALKAGKPVGVARLEVDRPIQAVIDWCNRCFVQGPSDVASRLHTWALEAQFLARSYIDFWRLPPEPKGVYTLEDLLRYELPNPIIVEEIVESRALGFPYTCRFDEVYLVEHLGQPVAVAKDLKTAGEVSTEFKNAYWQDPQLLGMFHVWNTTAEARGVPPLYAVVIDVLGKPGSGRRMPTFERINFPLRPDRVAVWAQSHALMAATFLRELDSAGSLDDVEAWRACPANFTACFTKRYRACERIPGCLALSDKRVYGSASEADRPLASLAPTDRAPEPSRVDAPAASEVVAAAPAEEPVIGAPITLRQVNAARSTAQVMGWSLEELDNFCGDLFNATLETLTKAEGAQLIQELQREALEAASDAAVHPTVYMRKDQRQLIGSLAAELGVPTEDLDRRSKLRFGRGFDELTAADADGLLDELKSLKAQVERSRAEAVEPPADPLPPRPAILECGDSEEWVKALKRELRSVLTQLLGLAQGDPMKTNYLAQIETAPDDVLRAMAAQFPEQGDRLTSKRSTIALRLELAKVTLEYALAATSGSQPAPVEAVPDAPLPEITVSAPEGEVVWAEPSAWPGVLVETFDPKLTYFPETWHPKQTRLASEVPRGGFCQASGVLAWATGERTESGDIKFLTEGGIVLGTKPDRVVVPITVKVVEPTAPPGADSPSVVGPVIGELTNDTGPVPVRYFGAWGRLSKDVKADIRKACTEPVYACALTGKNRALKLWTSVDGHQADVTKTKVGSDRWKLVQRMVEQFEQKLDGVEVGS